MESSVQQKIVVNGVTYASLSDVPAEDRRWIESLMEETGPTTNGSIEYRGPLRRRSFHRFTWSPADRDSSGESKIVVGNTTYASVDEMPAHERWLFETAMRDANLHAELEQLIDRIVATPGAMSRSSASANAYILPTTPSRPSAR